MAQKFLSLVKSGIFYEFSKWRKIEIRKTHHRAAEPAEREWVECNS